MRVVHTACTFHAQALATIDAAELTAWRSTFDGRPPPLELTSPCYAAIAAAEGAARAEGLPGVPLTESIRDCVDRIEPLWQREIRPAVLRRGKVAGAARAASAPVDPPVTHSAA